MRLIDADVLIEKAHQESKGMSYPYREDFGLLVEWIVDKTPAVQPQPDMPRYVSEIEAEYKKWVKMPYIKKPLAKALYEVWKKHNRENAERRIE